MTPSDWLLLLFQNADRPIDRVRVQKAMFLFSQRTKAPDDEKYDFVPYHYGPFSFEIYPDLDRLVAEGLLREDSDESSSSPTYVMTGRGRDAGERLRRAAPPKRLALLEGFREYVVVRNFRTLLEDIYRMYPSFAARSVFR